MHKMRYNRLTIMVSGLLIWAIYFVIVYAFTGVGCNSRLASTYILGINAIILILGIITLLALVLISLIGLRGWRDWQITRHQSALTSKEGLERQRFMGLVMLILAMLAFVATVFTGIPIFLLPPCQ